MPTQAQALRHRGDRDGLIALALRDVGALFRRFDSADAMREAARDLLPALYVLYGSAAATLSANWYDEVRESDGVRGRFQAIPAELKEDPGIDELIGWALAPLARPTHDRAAAQSLIEGGFQRRIADVSRATLMDSSLADPQATGWQRVAAGGGCGFCRMLADRGTVYSESTVAFGSHDHCRCSVVPAWGGQPQPVKPYTKTDRYPDTDAGRERQARDRARTYEWMRNNGYI